MEKYELCFLCFLRPLADLTHVSASWPWVVLTSAHDYFRLELSWSFLPFPFPTLTPGELKTSKLQGEVEG